MTTIYERDGLVARWHDAEQSIMLVRLTRAWSWQDAHEVLDAVNAALFAADHPVYTIILMAQGVAALPRGGAALSNLRRLMSVDPPNEEMILFIGGGAILRNFMGVVGKTYGLRSIFSKYHFVKSLDEALEKIATHRQGRVK